MRCGIRAIDWVGSWATENWVRGGREMVREKRRVKVYDASLGYQLNMDGVVALGCRSI